MPTGILLTASTVIPSLLLAFITALVALTLGCDWRNSSVTFFLQRGFGLYDFRVACFTVRPGRWYLDGEWAEPEGLAGSAIFLASSASNLINGVTIPVDGGYTAS